ncbi:MAG: YiiX family permuted papain-like enzyme [Bacteroidia bacterium]
MKKILFSLAICSLIFACHESQSREPLAKGKNATTAKGLHDGDIIFQSSMSGQSQAVQLATHSKYSHCGLLFFDDGKWMVYEAVQPVCKTPLTEWAKHGDGNAYVVRRLKNADSVMTASTVQKMRDAADARMGKNYDLWFGWSEEHIYCSELVWKCYQESTGLEIGATQELGTFDLSHPIVKKKLRERYGKKIPLKEKVISPGAIFESPLLETVEEK